MTHRERVLAALNRQPAAAQRNAENIPPLVDAARLDEIRLAVMNSAWAEISRDRSMLMLHVLEVDDAAKIAAHVKSAYERPLMEIFE